jgi:hypothetical protein
MFVVSFGPFGLEVENDLFRFFSHPVREKAGSLAASHPSIKVTITPTTSMLLLVPSLSHCHLKYYFRHTLHLHNQDDG